MTDNKDQADKESTLQEETLDDVASEQTETWQDDLPPEDDFHDQGEYQEELSDEIVDEASSDVIYEDQAPVEQAKRGKGVLFGALAIGALFVGGLAYMQFGSSGNNGSQNDPSKAMVDITAIKNGDQVSGADAKTDDLAAKSASKVDLQAAFDAAHSGAGGKNALPNGESGGMMAEKPVGMTSDILTSSSGPAPTPVAVVPAPPAPTPAAPVEKAVEVSPPAPVAAAAPLPIPTIDTIPTIAKIETIIPAPAAPKPEVEARIKAMNEQIETLKKSLDEAAQQNTVLLGRIESLQKQQAESLKVAAEAMKEKVPAPMVSQAHPVAEQVVSPEPAKPQASAAVDTAPAASGVHVDSDAGLSTLVQATTPKEAKKQVTSTVRKKVSPSRSTASKSSKSSQKWVLRAVTPDAAWVAQGADSNDLKRVSVGERLSGLGKIKQIRQNGETWEVVGETGVLR